MAEGGDRVGVRELERDRTLSGTTSALLREEMDLLSRQINLACNENVLSFAGEAALYSRYYSRYLLGRHETRGEDVSSELNGLVFGNLPKLSLIETRAHQAAQQLFKARFVETRFLSGLHAATSVILALSEPGETVWSLHPTSSAGHFATRSIAVRAGRKHGFVPWDERLHKIDVSQLADIGRNELPKLIFLDCGAPLFSLNVSELRDAVGDVSTIVYDGSHSLGLIAGGRFQRPFDEGADVLQGNTHKSFPGPAKAISVTDKETVHKAITEILSSAMVSSQDTAATAALHVTLLEMEEFARAYANTLVENAQIFGRELQKFGFKLFEVDGVFSESHILLVVLDSQEKAVGAAKKLISAGIVCNARNIYGRPTLRIGMQEITRRGITRRNLTELARVFFRVVNDEARNVDREILAIIASDLGARNFGWNWNEERSQTPEIAPAL